MSTCIYKMTWVAACISLMAVVLPNTRASAMAGGVAGVGGVSGRIFRAGSHGGAHGGVVKSHPGPGRGTVRRGGRRKRTVPPRHNHRSGGSNTLPGYDAREGAIVFRDLVGKAARRVRQVRAPWTVST